MNPVMTAAPAPELVFDTLFAYQRTAALRAAIEVDQFRAIGEGPGDAASSLSDAPRRSVESASCATS